MLLVSMQEVHSLFFAAQTTTHKEKIFVYEECLEIVFSALKVTEMLYRIKKKKIKNKNKTMTDVNK